MSRLIYGFIFVRGRLAVVSIIVVVVVGIVVSSLAYSYRRDTIIGPFTRESGRDGLSR